MPTIAGASRKIAGKFYDKGGEVFNVMHPDFGAIGDNTVDDTAAILAAVAAAPVGGRIIMPPPPVGYKITGDIILNKVGQRLLMDGAIINSVAGRLMLGANKTMIHGGRNSIFNFLNGNPALSLNQGVVASGTYNGSLLPITGTIAANAMSFVATNAGDLVGMVPGDWVIVGERTTDWQRQEWKQVLSVAGTTVNVTSPFRQAISTYTIGFYRVTPLEDCTVKGLFVNTTGVVDANIGVYPQLVRNFRLEDCRFNIAKGLPFALYMADKPRVTGNLTDRQSTQNAACSACYDGYVAYNHFLSKDGMPTIAGLLVETGTGWTKFKENTVVGAGGSGAFAVQWSDYNTFDRNTVISDGASVGLFINGGEGNQTRGNNFHQCLDGVRFATDLGPTPDRFAIGNSSIGDKVRNSTNGGNMGGSGNSIHLIDCDATVTTPVLDSGTNNSVLYKDPATGFMVITPAALPQVIALAGSAVNMTQIKFGTSGVIGAVGSRWSSADGFLVTNAVHNVGSDSWHQSSANISGLIIVKLNGDFEFYTAASGTADGNFATFWGTPKCALTAAGRLKLSNTQVVGSRVTGYSAMTGTANKATVYDTATVTLAQLAGRVMQLQTDLTGHGLIGA